MDNAGKRFGLPMRTLAFGGRRRTPVESSATALENSQSQVPRARIPPSPPATSRIRTQVRHSTPQRNYWPRVPNRRPPGRSGLGHRNAGPAERISSPDRPRRYPCLPQETRPRKWLAVRVGVGCRRRTTAHRSRRHWIRPSAVHPHAIPRIGPADLTLLKGLVCLAYHDHKSTNASHKRADSCPINSE